ncbi:hypothetical protein F8568_001250 [Actinomadura sp. LD22]|uniref:MobC family plasmid mobilization relaxosome protein n=1 Tax=Actinomadura physcomitrii TaxID=2650748 RepID=A0A6I4M3X3_9ACTN|nr:hypothetical protein [Actinomadura physcomitrii]MVZ99033.1 hypothetical protein [Actinomadura physcomitrii]
MKELMTQDRTNRTPKTATRRNRRTLHSPRRNRALFIALSDEEYASLAKAAANEKLAAGAWAAMTLLAAAEGKRRADSHELREVLQEVLHARAQAQRIGVNLNQAVAAWNSGELSPTLCWYARAAAQTVRKLDDLADELRSRLP